MRIGELVDQVQPGIFSHHRDGRSQGIGQFSRGAYDRYAFDILYGGPASGVDIMGIADPGDLHILLIIAGSGDGGIFYRQPEKKNGRVTGICNA